MARRLLDAKVETDRTLEEVARDAIYHYGTGDHLDKEGDEYWSDEDKLLAEKVACALEEIVTRSLKAHGWRRG